MTKLIHKTGDLFTSDAPAYAHGVNTFGRMGAGIAKGFRALDEEMFQAYVVECKEGRLNPGGLMVWAPDDGRKTIYNAASQDKPGAYAKIEWLRSAMWLVAEDADRRGYDRVAIPMIGTGIGGLDWPPVEAYLRGIAQSHKVDFEIWEYDA